MESEKKSAFENLSIEDQKKYLQKAEYLIQYNYVSEQDSYELARKIYEKNVK